MKSKYSQPEILVKRYQETKSHSAHEESRGFALEILAEDRKGLLADISAIITAEEGDIGYVQTWTDPDKKVHMLIQVLNENLEKILQEKISNIKGISNCKPQPTYLRTYGKRVIILGGGAQVAQVATGAITEADRHNIRGETISVDTIAVVGEQEIANAVRAVGRLHRASILVLAGSLMGGEITRAVTELREHYGIPVMALRMLGSVPDAVDVVVTDPLEAGVLAVMAISHVGKCNLLRLKNTEL